MNLEFDDSDQVEIHFTQKGLRRRYKGTIGGFFDRHRDGTRVGGMKFLISVAILVSDSVYVESDPRE
jgi:hypothetical protein